MLNINPSKHPKYLLLFRTLIVLLLASQTLAPVTIRTAAMVAAQPGASTTTYIVQATDGRC